MLNVFIVLMLAVLTACTGVSENYIRVEGDPGQPKVVDLPDGRKHIVHGSSYHYRVLENVNGDVNYIHKNVQQAGVKHCKYRYTSEQMAELRTRDKNQSWFYGCDKWEVRPAVIVASSVVEQIQSAVAAAIHSAGVAFAGHQIGRGLKGSGDDITNNNNTSSEGGDGGAGGLGIGKGGSSQIGPFKGTYKFYN